MTNEEAEKFKRTLQESLTFPCVYMYKFIVKSENRNIALVENLFEAGAEFIINLFCPQSGFGWLNKYQYFYPPKINKDEHSKE